MKKIIYVIVSAFVVSCGRSQTAEHHEWKTMITVVDDAGQPVANANAEMSWNVNRPDFTLASDKIEGVTDSNGVFRASHEANGSIGLGFYASKTGYYSSRTSYDLAHRKDNDAAKWNPVVTLLLKKMIHPIPMYAKYVEGGPPVMNERVGYDLLAGDWVAPRGKGSTADIFFTGKLDEKSKEDFDYTLSITFPNTGDGIQNFTVSDLEKTSRLRSPQEAPADGFQSKIVKVMNRHPGQGTKTDMNNPNQNYFFRIRTVCDEQGHIKSGLYGKIYGDFMQFRYYLNPTPNDRNVEFDPKQNLFPENSRGGVSLDMP